MFDPHCAISWLQPAKYNPRVIDEESIGQLRSSLRTLGLIKPVIANSNGVLIAGHQRTRAMQSEGWTHCPAYILQDVSLEGEIRFNQYHNACDVDFEPTANLHIPEQFNTGYTDIQPSQITGNIRSKGAAKKEEILYLLTKYGAWGSIIATQSGEVLVSQLYGICCKIMNIPCKAYIIENKYKEDVLKYFGQSYGQFSYEHLPLTTWGQTYAQPFRLREGENKTSWGSRTYDNFAIPRMAKGMRVLDFGAGQMDYVRMLHAKGYNIRGIEFYSRKGNNIDVSSVNRDIDNLCEDIAVNGLFDMVVCDSVVNSVDSLQAEEDVLNSLKALCKPSGLIIFSGRCKEALSDTMNSATKSVDKKHRRYVFFLDKNGFSAMFSRGVWLYQKMHSYPDLIQLCNKFFAHYKIYDAREGTAIQSKFIGTAWVVVARNEPVDLQTRLDALSREFNLSLPGDRSYGRSDDIVRAYKAALAMEVS